MQIVIYLLVLAAILAVIILFNKLLSYLQGEFPIWYFGFLIIASIGLFFLCRHGYTLLKSPGGTSGTWY